MRLPESDIAIIDRAANLRGRSRTDFVREAAVSCGRRSNHGKRADPDVACRFQGFRRRYFRARKACSGDGRAVQAQGAWDSGPK
jgi:hypothetical protein